MTTSTFRGLTLVILIAAAATGGSRIGRAEQTATAPDVLATLLVEVRGLRAAMEQVASAGPRVQLALGRLQLQEQRIGNQIRRLDAVKASLLAAQKEIESVEHAAREREEVIRDFPNSEGRREDEKQLAGLKAELARRHIEMQRLTAEESFLTQDIAAEQNRWSEFNQRLEDLERTLSRR